MNLLKLLKTNFVNSSIKVLLFIFCLLASKSLFSQGQVVPDGILFQAVARDANIMLLVIEMFTFKFILKKEI